MSPTSQNRKQKKKQEKRKSAFYSDEVTKVVRFVKCQKSINDLKHKEKLT